MHGMNDKQIEVGDKVAWADVPDGALVRPDNDARVYSMRINGGGRYVCSPKGVWRGFKEFPGTPWGWDTDADPPERTPAIIVALGLTGEETADDLRALAERFEVREALNVRPMMIGRLGVYVQAQRVWWQDGVTADKLRSLIAERLHAAGWKPGMTAEDAARLLGQRSADGA